MKICNQPERAFLCVIALLLAPGATSPAIASAAQARSTVVKTADLDLTSEQGRRQLDHRIRRAARLVCPKKSGSLVPAQPCVRQAEKMAWQSVWEKHSPAQASAEVHRREIELSQVRPGGEGEIE